MITSARGVPELGCLAFWIRLGSCLALRAQLVLFGAELGSWFYPEPETILGEAQRVLEM